MIGTAGDRTGVVAYHAVDGWHHWTLIGRGNRYELTVVHVPDGFHGSGYHGPAYLLVVLENWKTKAGGYPCYAFTLDDLERNPQYVAERLGLKRGVDRDVFVGLLKEYVAPDLIE